MFFATVFYGLLTWLPSYLFEVHGFDIKALGGATRFRRRTGSAA